MLMPNADNDLSPGGPADWSDEPGPRAVSQPSTRKHCKSGCFSLFSLSFVGSPAKSWVTPEGKPEKLFALTIVIFLLPYEAHKLTLTVVVKHLRKMGSEVSRRLIGAADTVVVA